MGRSLNLEDPQAFSEKIQWLKLYDRNPIYTTMVDKYEAKRWAAAQLGTEHVVPTLGVWDNFEEIDFEVLPEQFALKCTHDSGGLVICDDYSQFDRQRAKKKIEHSLSRNYFYSGREWPYLNVQPRVLAEVYFPTWQPSGATWDANLGTFESTNKNDITDYKFYCFNGEPRFLYVSQGLHDHSSAQMVFLTLDWRRTSFQRPDYLAMKELPPRPDSLDEMVEFARNLSTNIPFVRVDFFEHCGVPLFSEMTFHPVSGMMPLTPKSADFEIGQMLSLNSVR